MHRGRHDASPHLLQTRTRPRTRRSRRTTSTGPRADSEMHRGRSLIRSVAVPGGRRRCIDVAATLQLIFSRAAGPLFGEFSDWAGRTPRGGDAQPQPIFSSLRSAPVRSVARRRHVDVERYAGRRGVRVDDGDRVGAGRVAAAVGRARVAAARGRVAAAAALAERLDLAPERGVLAVQRRALERQPARPRSVRMNYPRRDVAATRLRGLSASQPRRRRDRLGSPE